MTSAVKPYDMVRIISSRFSNKGAPPGTIGHVVEGPKGEWLLVEVSRPDGTTIALLSGCRTECVSCQQKSSDRIGANSLRRFHMAVAFFQTGNPSNYLNPLPDLKGTRGNRTTDCR